MGGGGGGGGVGVPGKTQKSQGYLKDESLPGRGTPRPLGGGTRELAFLPSCFRSANVSQRRAQCRSDDPRQSDGGEEDEDHQNPWKKLKTCQNVLLLAGDTERLMEVVEESVGGGRGGGDRSRPAALMT